MSMVGQCATIFTRTHAQRRDFATISSNGDVEAQEGSAGQSTPTLLPTSYTVSVEKTIEGEEGKLPSIIVFT